MYVRSKSNVLYLWLVTLITITLVISGCGSDSKNSDEEIIVPDATDFNAYTEALTPVYSQATQMPLTGYFSKAVGTERSLKVYISEEAPLRSKWIVVAVPDGVETYTFLYEQGWIQLADKKGEAILALEPGADGWGSTAAEYDYVTAAMSFLTSTKNDNSISVISTYSTFYLVGYEGGCAPLEAWAAEYPIFVISQAYIGGPGAGQNYLDTVGAQEYNGKNTGGYNAGPDDADFIATLQSLGYSGDFITRADVPVPTMFVGYENSDYSIEYWKKANDVLADPDGDTYFQDINSQAWQTQYANSCILKDNADATYGIAQVKVSQSSGMKATAIYDFLSIYIRYTNTFAYSNNLEYRLDYAEMMVNAQKEAATGVKETKLVAKVDGTTIGYQIYAQQATAVKAFNDPDSGTVITGIFAFEDYNSDGVLDPRDYLIYVPNSAKDIWGSQGAPVVIVHPGMTQTASVFMDCAMWWQVADDEGCIIAIVGEKYNGSTGTSTTYDFTMETNANFDYVLADIMATTAEHYNIVLDQTRIYGAGHSLGSKTVQGLALSNTDLFSAVASTSFPSMSLSGEVIEESGEMIPIYLQHGESDLPFEMPDLWASTPLQDWAQSVFDANGLSTDIDSFDYSDTSGRFDTYGWSNSQDIPLVQYTYTLVREHNCIPEEQVLAWDYLKHYSFERDGIGNVTARYYSTSGFTTDDSVEILRSK